MIDCFPLAAPHVNCLAEYICIYTPHIGSIPNTYTTGLFLLETTACGLFHLTPGPSILIVLSGSLELACNGLTDKLHRGSVVFLPSGREAKFYPKVEEEALLFQAYCSL